jgi:hypothetical protein
MLARSAIVAGEKPKPAAPPKRGAGTTRCAMFSLILKRHLSGD